MRRKNFDYPDGRLDKELNGWVRVRDEGDKITLSYKQLNSRDLHGTEEVSIEVDNFDSACQFLIAVGFDQKSYQETKRESWQLGGVSIELDEWPWIKPFVEMEGPTEASLKQVSESLSLDWRKALHGSVENAYQAEYDFSEAEIDAWPEIKFGTAPDWLEQRRKK